MVAEQWSLDDTGQGELQYTKQQSNSSWEEYNNNKAAAGGELQSMHRYKLQPPYFTMVAYLGLQNSEFPRLLQKAETSNMEVTDWPP